jgi:hypothetical protein
VIETRPHTPLIADVPRVDPGSGVMSRSTATSRRDPRFAIGADGSLTLDDATAGLAVADQSGLRDEALSSDGPLLYALDADSHRIFGRAVGDHGSLDPIGFWIGCRQRSPAGAN